MHFYEFAGYGTFALKSKAKGDYLLEYRGDIISAEEARTREEKYRQESLGCFIFDLKHAGKSVW